MLCLQENGYPFSRYLSHITGFSNKGNYSVQIQEGKVLFPLVKEPQSDSPFHLSPTRCLYQMFQDPILFLHLYPSSHAKTWQCYKSH